MNKIIYDIIKDDMCILFLRGLTNKLLKETNEYIKKSEIIQLIKDVEMYNKNSHQKLYSLQYLFFKLKDLNIFTNTNK